MLLNRWQWFRERGWHEIDATTYADMWQQHGGSVATHPQIIERLSEFAKIPVRYLGWQQNNQLMAAIACWDETLALSRDKLKKVGKKGLFDIGNAEIILPMAEAALVTLRHKARYLSPLNQPQITNWRTQPEQLTNVKEMEQYSSKFRYKQRRKHRLLMEAGASIHPITDFTPAELASIYTELFRKRWGFDIPSAPTQTEVFTLLRDFMTGSLICLEEKPIAIQILFRTESPKWINIEFVNGGVDLEQETRYGPGTVLTYLNIENAWSEANQNNKALRYSFGRADRAYKDDWCHRIAVGYTN